MRREIAEILRTKARDARRLRELGVKAVVADRPRDFLGAMGRQGRCGLIAEIKFSSPSSGILRKRGDPVAIGKRYEEAGACALSVLTESRYFGGDIRFLPRLREAVSLPILRKDFLVHEVQVAESAAFGSDAVLLIASFLSPRRLAAMIAACRRARLAPLTEVHDEHDLEKALACGAQIIGINNRDLRTFRVNLAVTERLARLIPSGCFLVSESGIRSGEDVRRLRDAGAHAVLVGSALMRSGDVLDKARELVMRGEEKP